MTTIVPFKGLRPKKELAEQVATLPYDVCSVAEAKKFKDQPYNFYHVTRSEIDLPMTVDVHSQEVYDKAKENLEQMIEDGILIQDNDPCYYIYQLIMDGRKQTGLMCCSSIKDYNEAIIKKHEFTRPEKEKDRINHILTTKAQTGVVFLAYKDVDEINQIIENWKTDNAPEYDFIAEDGVQHTVWVMDEYAKVATISTVFKEQVPCTYIADGHHRAASAAKVAAKMDESEKEIDCDHSYNYFLTCIFPESQVAIMDYNRVVKDLNGMDAPQFLAALENDFIVEKVADNSAYRPKKMHEFGLYLDHNWYVIKAKDGTYESDPIGVLDVSILQNNILSKLLNINDPRTDNRVEFVGGIRGLQELENRVNSGEMAAAFSCYPVSVQQLFEVADSGNVMPPKSTWFEPKTRDGLVVHLI